MKEIFGSESDSPLPWDFGGISYRWKQISTIFPNFSTIPQLKQPHVALVPASRLNGPYLLPN
jgi:hypothetical protein